MAGVSDLSPVGVIAGVYVSDVMEVRSAGLRLHTAMSAAAPAAIAAPRAVVSGIDGHTVERRAHCRETGTLHRLEMGQMGSILKYQDHTRYR